MLELEPITRRKFFWFLGASFAMAAAGELSLPTTDIYFIKPSIGGVYSLSDINAVLKNIYIPELRKQLNQKGLYQALCAKGVCHANI